MKQKLVPLALALALAACGPTQIRSDAELRPEPVFDTVTEHADIHPGIAGQADLDLLLARNGARYGDRLIVSAGPDTIAGLKRRYSDTGIRILAAPGKSNPAGTPYRATFVRLVVTPPACGDWSEGRDADTDNKPSAHWGCAQLSNLTRMVADPNDLLAGREAETAYNTDADILAIRAYRRHAIGQVDVPTKTATVDN